MGTEGDGGNYAAAFLGAALIGLFLFYGFEACGDVAEEVKDPSRRIPRAMVMTILVGGVSALFSFGGYVLAAPEPGRHRERARSRIRSPASWTPRSDRSARRSSWSSPSSRSCRAC